MTRNLITIVEMSTFADKADSMLSTNELDNLRTMLASDPLCGDLIVGTGGLRKVRLGLDGRGKRGGARIVYYFRNKEIPLFLIAMFKKNEKDNLTDAEKAEARKLIDLLVKQYGGRGSS